jgi:hypothetical protein
MALTKQDAALRQERYLPHASSGPDYASEAERGRLHVRGSQQRRGSSQPIPPRTLTEEILASFRADLLNETTSFDLESRGGYARTVTGTVAYLDEEAQTFLVLVSDGGLERVPLRDITSKPGSAVSDRGQVSAHAGDGLGPDGDRGAGSTSQGARLP